MNSRWLGLTVLCAVALCACSEREVVVRRIKPASFFLPDVHTLAVVPFSGEGGEELALAVAHELTHRDFYKMVDRTLVQRMLDERQLLGLHAVGPSTVMSADALVTGSISANGYHEAVSHVITQGIDGDFIDVFTRDGGIELGLVVQAVSLTTGEVLDSRAFSIGKSIPSDRIYIHEDQFWFGRAPKFSPVNVTRLRNSLYEDLARDLADRMSPTFYSEAYTLYYDKRIPKSQEATRAAQEGRWEDALALYEQGVAEAAHSSQPAKYRARAHHCLAVALTVAQRYNEARIAAQNALHLHHDKVFTAMLTKIDEARHDLQQTQDQLQCIARRRAFKLEAANNG